MELKDSILTTPKGNKITVKQDVSKQLEKINVEYKDRVLYGKSESFSRFRFSEAYMYHDTIPYYVLWCQQKYSVDDYGGETSGYDYEFATYAVDLISGQLIHTLEENLSKVYDALKSYCDHYDTWLDLKLRVARLEAIIEHLATRAKNMDELGAVFEEAQMQVDKKEK